MFYRRKVYKRKPFRKPYRKRNFKRTTAVARRTNVRKDIHFFKRSYNFGGLTGNAAYSPYLAGNTTSLSLLPNATEFSALFDRYMITHWQLKFYLKIDPSAQSAASASYPRMWWVADYDDSIAPVSLDDIRQHGKVKNAVLLPNRPLVINIKPAVLSLLYQSALTNQYCPKWRTWVDCAQLSTAHYGLKYGIDDFTNTNYTLNVESTLWFACKDTR